MKTKLIIPCLYMMNGQAVTGFGHKNVFAGGDLRALTAHYSNMGADEILVFDFSTTDEEHDEAIATLKELCNIAEVSVIGAGHVNGMEDIKKFIYAGCTRVVLNFSKETNIALIETVSKKFGKEKVVVSISYLEEFEDNQELIESYAGAILCLENVQDQIREMTSIPIYLHTNHGDAKAIEELLKSDAVNGVSGVFVSDPATELMPFKWRCVNAGISMNVLESKISWSEFKLNADLMVPVIVQDYKTDEVLMLAYMNEEAFLKTLETGMMTYWSRSRNELWTKGLTSGHVQYVKSLTIDCDKDTMLAKVSQVGAACHTGNRTCFFQNLVQKECDITNPLKVFEGVYEAILKSNVASDGGELDEIIEKLGLEFTKVLLAAKNPEQEQMKYEISDFLYHMMNLMVQKGVNWEDITKELTHR